MGFVDRYGTPHAIPMRRLVQLCPEVDTAVQTAVCHRAGEEGEYTRYVRAYAPNGGSAAAAGEQANVMPKRIAMPSHNENDR